MNLEALAIKIDSRLRVLTLGIRQMSSHVAPMDDSSRAFSLHLNADNVDDIYYKKIAEAIQHAKKEGLKGQSYDLYKQILKKAQSSVKHQGYRSLNS